MDFVLGLCGVVGGVAQAAALLAASANRELSKSFPGRIAWTLVGLVALVAPLIGLAMLDRVVGPATRAEVALHVSSLWVGTCWLLIAFNWEELRLAKSGPDAGPRRLPSLRNCLSLTRRRIAFALSATVPILILMLGVSSYAWVSPLLQSVFALDVSQADHLGGVVFSAGLVAFIGSAAFFPRWCLRVVGHLTSVEIEWAARAFSIPRSAR